ncbi:MAG: diguanylate cyclase [Rhodospirillales bacterium]
MHFIEPMGEASGHARTALEKMITRSVPPHPNNFMVWYCFVADLIPDLTRRLETLIDDGAAFEQGLNEDLFNQYFSFDNEGVAINHVARQAESELSQLADVLGRAGADTASYRTLLTDLGSKLTAAGVDVSDLVRKAHQATDAMCAQTQELEERLTASSNEILKLRSDLETLRREALTDALTGIANRKLFDAELHRVIKDAGHAAEAGAARALSLLMVDVDHFKAFNDTHGHPTGDQVLKLMASKLKRAIKGQDTAARYGGEEFAVILPDTDLVGASAVAEDIRTKVRSRRLTDARRKADLGRITVSIGVALYRLGESPEAFIHRADVALYSAKRQGRDRVVSEDQVDEVAVDFA